MVMKVIRRAVYGVIAWAFVFALYLLLSFYATDYSWFTVLAAPVAFYWLSKRCLRKKPPYFGSEGLKVGGIWMLVFAFLDLVLVPVLYAPYGAYVASHLWLIIYSELMLVPWMADKYMTGKRKI
jgi:hypothetical protein